MTNVLTSQLTFTYFIDSGRFALLTGSQRETGRHKEGSREHCGRRIVVEKERRIDRFMKDELTTFNVDFELKWTHSCRNRAR